MDRDLHSHTSQLIVDCNRNSVGVQENAVSFGELALPADTANVAIGYAEDFCDQCRLDFAARFGAVREDPSDIDLLCLIERLNFVEALQHFAKARRGGLVGKSDERLTA